VLLYSYTIAYIKPVKTHFKAVSVNDHSGERKGQEELTKA